MLIPPTTTDVGDVAGRDGSIGADMNAVAFAAEDATRGILDCTVFHGFFKSDTPHVSKPTPPLKRLSSVRVAMIVVSVFAHGCLRFMP
jgi:hypothetical protein